jgi:hypothetical protein
VKVQQLPITINIKNIKHQHNAKSSQELVTTAKSLNILHVKKRQTRKLANYLIMLIIT